MSKLNVGDNMFNFISLIIIIVGAINWFCIGVFQFDLIAGIFGTQSHFFSRFIYTIIGLAGLWFLAYTLIKKGQLSLLPKKTKKTNTDSIKQESKQSENNISTLEDNTKEHYTTNDSNSKKSKKASVESKDTNNKQNATSLPQNITLTISNDTPSSNSISNKSSNISTPKSTTKKRTTKKKNADTSTINN